MSIFNLKKSRELKNVTITHVSYVKHPANKRGFLVAKTDGTFELNVNFLQRSEQVDTGDERLLYGIVYEPDVEDSYGDSMSAEEIEKTAHEFLEFYRNMDTEHNVVAGAGAVVESYIAPVDITIGETLVKAGTWILATRASDEVWQKWKNGEITGYSMFGMAREVVSKGEQRMSSFVSNVLEKLGVKKSYEESMQNKLESMIKSAYFIIGVMEDDFYKSIDWTMENKEVLAKLAEAMRSAADYIDSNYVVEKSAAEDEAESDKSDETSETESETSVAKTDENAEPESEPDENEGEKPEEENEQVPVEKSQPVNIVEVVKSAIQNELLTITDSIKTEVISTISKNLNELTEKIEKIETASSVRVADSNAEPVGRIARSSGVNLL